MVGEVDRRSFLECFQRLLVTDIVLYNTFFDFKPCKRIPVTNIKSWNVATYNIARNFVRSSWIWWKIMLSCLFKNWPGGLTLQYLYKNLSFLTESLLLLFLLDLILKKLVKIILLNIVLFSLLKTILHKVFNQQSRTPKLFLMGIKSETGCNSYFIWVKCRRSTQKF